MSDEHSRPGGGRGDILAELEAEVAHELEEQRPPAGGPAYQVAAALVPLAVGVLGAVLAYGYGLNKEILRGVIACSPTLRWSGCC